jgi:hypothetical protein
LGFSSNVLGALSDTGQQKWRPFTQAAFAALQQADILNYRIVDWLNALGLGIVALLTFWIASYVLRLSFLMSLGICLGVAYSRFVPYASTQLFGLMEIMALLACLSGAGLFLLSQGAENDRPNTPPEAAVLLFFIASLFHERYAFILLASVLFLVLQAVFGRSRLSSAVLLGSLFILIHWWIRVWVIQIDAVKSGGARSIREVAGPWIVEHFALSISAIFGGVWNDYFISSPSDSRDYYRTSPWLLGMALVAVPLLIVIVVASSGKPLTDLRLLDRIWKTRVSVLLVFSLALLIPASLVIERIETRWLLASEILIWLTVAAFVEHVLKTRVAVGLPRLLLGLSAIGGWLFLGLSCNVGRSEPSLLRSKAAEVLREAELKAPRNGNWAVSVDVEDFEYESWMFGYGYSLTQLQRPPSWWVPNGQCPDLTDVPCVNVISPALGEKSNEELDFEDESSEQRGRDRDPGS